MKTKNPNPYKFVEGKNLDPIIRIYFQINHLKHLLRQGWLMRGIPEDKCESVGDHCFATALLSLLIAEKYFPQLNVDKIIRMSLFHDIGEIYGGDITPHDGISKEEKHNLEKESVKKIFSGFPKGEEYLDLWEEFEESQTPEAKFVKQIDKLEMAFQASVYAKQYSKNLDEFIDSAREKIEDKKLLGLMDELRKI